MLRRLAGPPAVDVPERCACRVDTGSMIHVGGNTYSVPSRLIGEWVEARLYADRVEVWYADQHVDTLPRLRGRGQACASHYRHVIDWLVRKPGAFADYGYRDDLFPTSRFRLAYDRFCEGRETGRGAKEYLEILHLAAHDSEVRGRRRVARSRWRGTSSTRPVIALAKAQCEQFRPPTAVVVEPPDLTEYDALLTLTEEIHGEDSRTNQRAVRATRADSTTARIVRKNV